MMGCDSYPRSTVPIHDRWASPLALFGAAMRRPALHAMDWLRSARSRQRDDVAVPARRVFRSLLSAVYACAFATLGGTFPINLAEAKAGVCAGVADGA